jgi:hypothetical protein
LNPEADEFSRHPRQLFGFLIGDARHDLQAIASANTS